MCYLINLILRTPLLLIAYLIPYEVSAQRPNIIYIMADDLGYADLSLYGRKEYQTPHLDKLGTEGMRFTSAYAAAAVCTPTRAAFMTGRYPARLAIGLLEPWIPSKRDQAIGLSRSDFSIARALTEAGYETALIGKWHLGTTADYSPRANGFEYFYGIKTGAADYVSHKGDDGKVDLYENDSIIRPEGYMTELLGAQTEKFLKMKHNRPFFLSLQFTAPHWPWQATGDTALPDSLFKKPRGMQANGSPAIYASMMKSLDDQIGRIMQAIAEAGIEKNTIIIFTSDNGGEKFSDMGPYSKGKMNVWEGGVRVPAFVKWQGKISAGTVTSQPVITMDWSATILGIAGARSDPKFPLDGINLLPVLTTKNKLIDRTFYWRLTQRANQHAVHAGKWKYIFDNNAEYLFDLSKDPGEKNDLKNAEPVKFKELQKQFSQWEKTVLAPLPLQGQ